MNQRMTNKTDVKDTLSNGNIPFLLRKMAIPGVISQILLLLYNMVDRIYLGRLHDGGTALLAVGLCLPVTYIFNAFAFLFGQGGAARSMIRLGSGKRDEAENIMGNSVLSIILSGINQGAQALLSYNYGGGNYDRVMQTAKTLLKFQFLFFWPMTALLELFPEVFIRIFTSDPAVIAEAAWMVRVYAAGFFVIPIQAVFQQINLSTGQERACLFMVIIRRVKS